MEWSPLEAEATAQQRATPTAQAAGAAPNGNVSFAPDAAPTAPPEPGTDFTFAKPANAGMTPPPLGSFGAQAQDPAAAAIDFAAHFKKQQAAATQAEGLPQRDDSAGAGGKGRSHRQAPGVRLRHRAQATANGRTTPASPIKTSPVPAATAPAQAAEPVAPTEPHEGATQPDPQCAPACVLVHRVHLECQDVASLSGCQRLPLLRTSLVYAMSVVHHCYVQMGAFGTTC